MDAVITVLCRVTVLILLLATIAGSITACSPIPPFLPDSNLFMPALSDNSLLTNESCEPPCWHDLYPDRTLASQAEELLKKLPFVDPKSIVRDQRVDHGYDPAIEWSYVGAWSSDHGGRMTIVDGVVRNNRVFLPLGSITLGGVIEVQGAPDLVVAGRDPESPTHWFQFFYKEKGLLLHGRKNGRGQKTATITSDIAIIEAEYFSPRALQDFLTQVRGYRDAKAIEDRIRTYVQWPGLDESIPLESWLPR